VGCNCLSRAYDLAGVLGWVVASFFGKPLIEFLDLRRKVHEEIVYTGNVGFMDLQDEKQRARYDEAVENLRRLGAKVQAIDVAATTPLRFVLLKVGFNLEQAGRGLIGLSNSLHLRDGGRMMQTAWIQNGLKLPRDFTDEQIRESRKRMEQGGQM